MLDVLRGQVPAQRLGARVEVEQRRQPRQRALGAAVGRAAQRGHHLGVNGERVAAGERGQPAFGRLRVDQGVFRGFPKSEHPSRPARGAFKVRRSCGRAVAAAAFEAIAWSRRTRADDCGVASVADDPERPMMAQTPGRGNRRARVCCGEDGSRRSRRHGDARPPRARSGRRACCGSFAAGDDPEGSATATGTHRAWYAPCCTECDARPGPEGSTCAPCGPRVTLRGIRYTLCCTTRASHWAPGLGRDTTTMGILIKAPTRRPEAPAGLATSPDAAVDTRGALHIREVVRIDRPAPRAALHVAAPLRLPRRRCATASAIASIRPTRWRG